MSTPKLPISTRQKWASVLANTADGAFVVDAAQRIVCWNQGAQKLLGYSQAEVLNQYCYEVLAGSKCRGRLRCYAGCNVQRAIRKGRLPQDFDLLARSRHDKDTWVNMSTIAIHGGKKPLTAHLIREANCHKRNESMIRAVRKTVGLVDFSESRTDGNEARGLQNRVLPRSILGQDDRLSRLSSREAEVLILLASSLSTMEVATRIGVSLFTVRSHTRNILHKLRLHSKCQAVALACAHGLC